MEGKIKGQTVIVKPRKLLYTIINDENDINIDDLIQQLKDYGMTTKDKLDLIMKKSENILINQPNVLRLQSPIKIVGDIHGQFYDLLHIFQKFGRFPDQKFLFLGDYVDRGRFCIEVITFLLALKCKYPKNIFLLRGNHQGKLMTQNFNFKLQCIKKYNINYYQKFLQLFCKLPLSALVDNQYFCVHGGISPLFKKIKQLDTINRFRQLQNHGIICDLVWSDPTCNSSVFWEKNKIRSCSYYYSKRQAEKFVEDNKISMIIRGHQVQMKGYAYQYSQIREKLTLTIFSAPNYCDSYRNKAAIAIINKHNLSIQTFSQNEHPFVFPNYLNLFQWSIPLIATETSKVFLHLMHTMQNNQRVLSQEQLNALKKVQCLSLLLEGKKRLNVQLLLKGDQLQEFLQSQEYQANFILKKQNDLCEKLPNNVIGPKHVQFKKVNFKTKENDQNFDPAFSLNFQS